MDQVAIVGGGVIGLSTAWHLAKHGARVTLLERDTLGSGASGVPYAALWPPAANSRGLAQNLHWQSLAMYPDFVRELSQESGLPIEYRRVPRIEVAASKARAHALIKEAETCQKTWPDVDGQPVQEVLSRKTIGSIEPVVYSQLVWDPLLCRFSAYVRTCELLAALRAACEARGVSIEEGREVKSIQTEGDRVTGVLADREYPASAVLVAAGAWTSSLHPALAVSAPVTPLKGQVMLLRQHASEKLTHMLKCQKAYMFPTASGRVAVGASSEPEAGFDRSITAKARKQIAKEAGVVLGTIGWTTVVEQWAGHRPEPARQKPYLGAVPGVRGLYVAAGHFKTGVGMAPITGKLMSEMILGLPASIVIKALAPESL